MTSRSKPPATPAPATPAPASSPSGPAASAKQGEDGQVAVLDLTTGRVTQLSAAAARGLVAGGKARIATARDRALAGL